MRAVGRVRPRPRIDFSSTPFAPICAGLNSLCSPPPAGNGRGDKIERAFGFAAQRRSVGHLAKRDYRLSLASDIQCGTVSVIDDAPPRKEEAPTTERSRIPSSMTPRKKGGDLQPT